MFCSILVLPEGESELVATFTEWALEADPKIEAKRVGAWETLAWDLVRRSRRLDSRASEVFLCFAGKYLVNQLAVGPFEKLLDLAKANSWGGATFVVTRWDLDVSDLLPNRGEFLKWLKAAWEKRAADILQAHDPSSMEFDPEILQEACRQADARRAYLIDRAPQGRWSCKVRMERWRLAELLGGESWFSLPRTEHLVVVVDRSEAEDQMALVEEAVSDVESQGGGRILIATLNADPSEDLVGFCREHALDLVAFSGVLELWYFFIRLNENHFESSEEVAIDQQPAVFSCPEPQSCILFTNSWDPDAGTGRQEVLSAARDLNGILVAASQSTRLQVDLAATCERLFQQIDWLGASLIWIHTGPGSESRGLVDARGRKVPAEEWLKCFVDRGRRLPIAVFLSGGSAAVARYFAEAGAGVTIGFEGANVTAQSRLLVIDMLHVALRAGSSRLSLLSAWDFLVKGLGNESDSSRPKAYYSRRVSAS